MKSAIFAICFGFFGTMFLSSCTETVYVQTTPKVTKFEAISMWYPGCYCIHFRDNDQLRVEQFYNANRQILKDDAKKGESMYYTEIPDASGTTYYTFHIHSLKELGMSGYTSDGSDSAILKVE